MPFQRSCLNEEPLDSAREMIRIALAPIRHSRSSADADKELADLSSWLRELPKPCGILVSDDMRACTC